MCAMLSTDLMSHKEIFPLNEVASQNMLFIVVTAVTSPLVAAVATKVLYRLDRDASSAASVVRRSFSTEPAMPPMQESSSLSGVQQRRTNKAALILGLVAAACQIVLAVDAALLLEGQICSDNYFRFAVVELPLMLAVCACLGAASLFSAPWLCPQMARAFEDLHLERANTREKLRNRKANADQKTASV